jgi:hypothetical protein
MWEGLDVRKYKKKKKKKRESVKKSCLGTTEPEVKMLKYGHIV